MSRPPILAPPRWRTLRAAIAGLALALLCTLVVSGPASAQATGVDLETVLWWHDDDPVTAAGVTKSIDGIVRNLGDQPATNVTLSVVLPGSAELLASGDVDCDVETDVVTCAVGDMTAHSESVVPLGIRFTTTGTHQVTGWTTADQPDVDGNATATLDVIVVDEESDLAVRDGTERVLTGASHEVEQILWNEGPTVATGVTVTGTFPAGATVDLDTFHIGADVNQVVPGRCAFTATTFTCGQIEIDPFGGIELRYTITAPTEVGTIAATVSLVGRNDPDPTNDTGTLTLEVAEPFAELRLDLIASGPQPAGVPFDATVWTWNVGDGAAEDVTTSLQVPAGWSVAAPTVPEPGRTCATVPAERLVHCTWGSVDPEDRADLTVPVTPPATGSGTGTLVATTTSSSPEAGDYPNRGTIDVAFAPTGVDLEVVSATHDPAVPLSGPVESTVTWQVRSNTPDRLATDVLYAVSLPEGVHATFMEAMREDGGIACDVDPSDRTPSCGLTGSAPVGEVELTIWVTYDTGGSYDLTASVSQASTEQAPGDESLTHTVEVETAEADLQLRAEVAAEEVTVGDETSYLVRVRNDGPHAATDVRLHDELPAGVELVSVRRGWIGWRCPIDDDAYTCDLGRIAAGASTFVVVTVRATAAGTVASTPTLTALQDDPDPTSNTADVAFTVVEPGDETSSDLIVIRIPGPGPVVAGEPFAERYVIWNDGPRAVTGVTLTVVDGDEANLDVTGAEFGWLSRPCGATTTCSIPTIAGGGYAVVTVTAVPLRPGVIETTATVSADQPDADVANNTTSVRLDVVDA